MSLNIVLLQESTEQDGHAKRTADVCKGLTAQVLLS